MRRTLLLIAIVLAAVGCTRTQDQPMDSLSFSATDRDQDPNGAIHAGLTDPTTMADSPLPVIHQRTTDAGSPSAHGLVWTVIAVEPNDVLSVRQLPDESAAVVGALAPWASNFWVTNRVKLTTSTEWRLITMETGERGWVDSRHLVGQPAELSRRDKQKITDSIEGLVAWLHDETQLRRFALADGAMWMKTLSCDPDRPSTWSRIERSALTTGAGWVSSGLIDILGSSEPTPLKENGMCGESAVHTVQKGRSLRLVFDWSQGQPALLALVRTAESKG